MRELTAIVLFVAAASAAAPKISLIFLLLGFIVLIPWRQSARRTGRR